MLVKIKGKDNITFNNSLELIEYSKNIISNLKKYDILNTFYNKNKNEIFNGVKKFNKILKSLFYNKTNLNINYWISRGWDEKESRNKIQEIQTERSLKSKKKMEDLKKENFNLWSSKKNTHLNYYYNLGYNEEESKKLLKERQNTFSLEKCIKKYGKLKGEKIWNDRQNKWTNTMSLLKFNTDSNSPEFYKNKYGTEWIYYAIDNSSFKNERKDLLKNKIKIHKKNFNNIIKSLNDEKEITSLSDVYFIYNSSHLQSYFNLSYKEMTNIIYKNCNITNGIFGSIKYFNEHICRSIGEYNIAKFLYENNIYYIYEKNYPNSNFITDFYIPEYNLYIEYLGMLNPKYKTEKYHPEIYIDYLNKYKEKEKYCINNKLDYIFERDYNKLIKKISEWKKQ